jgi:hypothetical protein
MKTECVLTCLSGPRCWRGLSCEVRKFAAECSRLGRRIRMLCRAARVYSWAGCWADEEEFNLCSFLGLLRDLTQKTFENEISSMGLVL